MTADMNGGQPIQPIQVPESVQIDQCIVGSVELPNGVMGLIFTLPGIRRYTFILDAGGRRAVAQLCMGGLQIAGTADMPPPPR
jgi:hypothetical protein